MRMMTHHHNALLEQQGEGENRESYKLLYGNLHRYFSQRIELVSLVPPAQQLHASTLSRRERCRSLPTLGSPHLSKLQLRRFGLVKNTEDRLLASAQWAHQCRKWDRFL
jgi:hypothetical protein